MKEIPLNHGHIALVDDADFESVSQFKWTALPHHRTVYAIRKVGKTIQRMHRFIMELSDPAVQVDHRDHDGLNNQRGNLRPATNAQNRSNGRKPATGHTSRFKGVYWNKKDGKFRAQIKVLQLNIYLGLFDQEIDAARAYNKAAVRHFGEFAQLNDVTQPTKL
jgi:hypothetical protein